MQDAAERFVYWRSMLNKPLPKGTKVIDVQFVLDLIKCQPLWRECAQRSLPVGGLGYHVPVDVELLVGSVLGVYGYGTESSEFMYEHPNSDQVVYGKPRNDGCTPGLSVMNAAKGLPKSDEYDTFTDIGWYYLLLDGKHTNEQIKQLLAGYVVEVQNGNHKGELAVMMYTSMKKRSVSKGTELFVRTYGNIFWNNFHHNASVFKLQNKKQHSFVVTSYQMQSDSKEFFGLFWGQIVGNKIFYSADDDTDTNSVSLNDRDGIEFGDGHVLNSLNKISVRPNFYGRLVFSDAALRAFPNGHKDGVVYVCKLFKNVLNEDGQTIGTVDRALFKTVFESNYVASSIVDNVLNNCFMEIDAKDQLSASCIDEEEMYIDECGDVSEHEENDAPVESDADVAEDICKQLFAEVLTEFAAEAVAQSALVSLAFSGNGELSSEDERDNIVHSLSVDGIVNSAKRPASIYVEADVESSEAPISVSNFCDTPCSRKRLKIVSSSRTFIDPVSVASINTQTDALGVSTDTQTELFNASVDTQTELSTVSVGVQTHYPFSNPRTLADFLDICADGLDGDSLLSLCTSIASLSLSESSPLLQKRAFKFLMEHKDYLFDVVERQRFPPLPVFEVLSNLLLLAAMLYEPYLTLRQLLRSFTVSPRFFKILSEEADTTPDGVSFYVDVASLLLARGLFVPICNGLSLFVSKLKTMPVIEHCGIDAALKVNFFMTQAALASPELHDSVYKWRLRLIV